MTTRVFGAGLGREHVRVGGAGCFGRVVCRTGRVLLWVSTVRPCRSIADSRTNVKTARLAARLEFSGS
jgi:hypothetical protein